MVLPAWLLLLLIVLATIRLARLLAADVFPPVVWLRARLLRHLGDEHWAYVLLTCRWCSSFWIGAGIAYTGLRWGEHLWWLTPIIALAASLLSGWAALAEDRTG